MLFFRWMYRCVCVPRDDVTVEQTREKEKIECERGGEKHNWRKVRTNAVVRVKRGLRTRKRQPPQLTGPLLISGLRGRDLEGLSRPFAVAPSRCRRFCFRVRV